MHTKPTKPSATFFWRKLDHPGHDSCRLFELRSGWRLAGAAVFWERGRACHFGYEVLVDSRWRTRRARVAGYLGNERIDVRIDAAGRGRWRVGGALCDELAGCADVDLAFTPATNMIAVRRLALKVGQAAEAPAAWLEFPKMRVVRLPQTYRRIGATEYAYEAPTLDFRAVLEVSRTGAVVHYPGLFERVTSG